MKLDKKKRYTIQDGIELYAYIAHDSKCVLLRNIVDGLIVQVPLTARIFEQIDAQGKRLLAFSGELRNKKLALNTTDIIDLLAKHHLKVVDLEVQPVKMVGQCSCTGCTNKATHTWSGHPTCDACK